MDRFAIVFAGPSAGGKTTVGDKLIAEDGIYSMSRSATTRAPRGDGRDDEYIYMSRDQFLNAIADGDILEHTEYSGNMYGTRKSELDRILSEGKFPILVLDLNGVESLKRAALPYPVYAFYLYNDLAVIAERLRAREALSADKSGYFEKRMAVNVEDYISMKDRTRFFDRFIKNGDLDECLCTVRDTLRRLSSGESFLDENEAVAAELGINAKNYRQ